MIFKVVLSLVACYEFSSALVTYDAYFGKPLAGRRAEYLAASNATSLCTVTIEPCREGEGRRVDGSCSNPKYPSRGATLTPLPRLLPPEFGAGNSLRAAKDGSPLPSTRLLRTKLLSEGFLPAKPFTQLATHTYVFSFVDSVDLMYLLRYGLVSDCCVGNTPNRVNPQCIPIEVPDDDPVLRSTGVRCMNLTKVETYQDFGCLPPNLPPERYNRVPPLLDLSPIYGNTGQRVREVRAYKGGELRVEQKQNRETPPSDGITCLTNRRPVENACYEYGDAYDGNLLIGVNLNSLWFYREHNRLARGLAKINPCWDDQKLFETARQINIAQWQHIFFYELIPNFIGRKNAIAEGIIHDTDGYVDDFDMRYEPGTYREYVIGARWFHTIQDSRTDLYSSKGRYLGFRWTVDDAFRTGVLEVNNTESYLTNGAYRQSAGKPDDIVDLDLSERLYPDSFQRSSDLPAIDMMRGRDAGLPPYNSYRKLCGLPVAKTFEDFHDTIDGEKILAMKRIYDDVDDVDLMTAIYAERLMPGAWVGPTLYCIMVNNFLLWRRSDLYFFEHGRHFSKLTLPQLNSIRKSSIARILCDDGDDVKQIQPYAFIQAGHGNEIVSCDKIPGTDLNKWSDPICDKDNAKEISCNNGNDCDDNYVGGDAYLNLKIAGHPKTDNNQVP